MSEQRNEPGAVRLFAWAFFFMLYGWAGLVLFVLTVVFGALIWVWFLIPVFFGLLWLTRRYVDFHRASTPGSWAGRRPVPTGRSRRATGSASCGRSSAIRRRCGNCSPRPRATSGQALSELRDLVPGIHPPVLADRGLEGAVRALGLACTVPTEVGIDLPSRPSAPVESAAYFAICEALANVMKHSDADKAWVRITYAGGKLLMLVGDDGRGGADASGGTRIHGLERRLAAFDGTVFISSPPGGPTVVSMDLPCELPAADATH